MAQPAFQPASPIDPTVLEHHRNRATYHYVVYTLHQALPPPPTDEPAMLARRNAAALAAVAALDPADNAELQLAVQFAAASFQATDCARLANRPGTEFAIQVKCFDQANAMRRHAKAALKALAQLREARAKQEARDKGSLGWAGHIALKYMTDALAEIAPEATLDAVPMEDSPAEATPADQAPATQPEASVTSPEDPPPEADGVAPVTAAAVAAAAETYLPADVEDYAIRYPERVALIRRHGGVPRNVSFGPPDQWIVDVLVSTKAPMILNIERNADKRRR